MNEIYRFDGFTLDARAFELRRGSEKLPVEPLVFDLLMLMAKHPGKLLTRDELIDSVWDGRIVSESTISTAIKLARKALGDTGADQKIIRTVRGRGIQFLSDVAVEGSPLQIAAATPACPSPSLYVRAVGTGDDITHLQVRTFETRLRSTLSRVPMLDISAPFASAIDLNDPRAFLANYDITQLVDIHLERDAAKLRADVSLTETRNGRQTWARAFQMEDVAGAQEVLLHQVVAALEPELMRSMIASLSQQGGQADARARVLKAVGLLAIRGWNRETFNSAEEMLLSALEEEPQIALGHAYLALIRALGHRVGILRNRPNVIPEAISAAERALALENGDSGLLGVIGCAFCDAGSLDRGLPILNRAIELDPSNGHALTAKGAAYLMRGEFEEAVGLLREGMQISPADSRLSIWGALLALALLLSGQQDEAGRAAEEAASRDDMNYLSRLALAAVRAAGHDSAGLRSAVRELLRVNPQITEDEVLYFAGKQLKEPIWKEVTTQR